MRILRLQNHKSGWGQDTQAMVSSPPPFIADYLTSKTGSWAILNKICQNDLTRYCYNGIINFLKKKKIKTGCPGHSIFTPWGEDNQGGGEDTPGNFNPPGVKLPVGILTSRGQAAQGSRYTGIWNSMKKIVPEEVPLRLFLLQVYVWQAWYTFMLGYNSKLQSHCIHYRLGMLVLDSKQPSKKANTKISGLHH